MPIAKFEMPDGRIARFEMPEGSTPEEAQATFDDFTNSQTQEPTEDAGTALPDAFSKAANNNEPMKWGDVGLEAISNIPKSTGEFAGNIYEAIANPVQTVQNIGSLAAGLVDRGATKLESAVPDSIRNAINAVGGSAIEAPGWEKSRALVDAAGNMVSDRYGGKENIKKTIASDPVGVLADASALLTGGGTLAAKLPGTVGKLGKMTATVGKTVDPINIAGKAIKPVLKKTGSVVSSLIGGLGTHTGGESISKAASAGYRGGQVADDFQANIRQEVPFDEVVGEAKGALANVRKERGAEYVAGMTGIKSDQKVLKMSPIDKVMQDIVDIGTFKGKSISKSTTSTLKQITDVVDEWRGADPANFHTAEGFDALKRAIGDVRDSTEFGSPSRLVADKAYNAVKDQIVKQAPEYANVMKGYEEASSKIRELEGTFSLGSKKSPDTALRKLQSTMRNNVNTNYGNRINLVKELEDAGASNILEKLAGQALSSWTPRGLGSIVAGGSGAAGLATMNPMLAIPVAMQSPRLVGEASYYAGKTAGAGSDASRLLNEFLARGGASNRGAVAGAFQAGRLNEQEQAELLRRAIQNRSE